MRFVQKILQLAKTALYIVLYFPAAVIILSTFAYLFYTCINSTLGLGVTIVLAYIISNKCRRFKQPIAVGVSLFFVTMILLAVLLASLNSSRSISTSAIVKQSLGNIRAQAELVYENYGYSYESICNDKNVNLLIDKASESAQSIEIKDRSCLGKIPQYFLKSHADEMKQVHHRCTASEDEYQVKLYIPAYDLYWCVDSNGEVKFPNPDYQIITPDKLCE